MRLLFNRRELVQEELNHLVNECVVSLIMNGHETMVMSDLERIEKIDNRCIMYLYVSEEYFEGVGTIFEFSFGTTPKIRDLKAWYVGSTMSECDNNFPAHGIQLGDSFKEYCNLLKRARKTLVPLHEDSISSTIAIVEIDFGKAQTMYNLVKL